MNRAIGIPRANFVPCAVALLIALAVAACEPASEPGERDEVQPETTAASRADTARLPEPTGLPGPTPGVDLGTLLDEASRRDDAGHLVILDRLNEPARVDTALQENRHVRGRTDTLFTHHYEGLALTVYHAANGKEILQSITVTGEQYETEEGLHVGMERNQVESLWGEPSERAGGEHVYERNGPMPVSVRVAFDGDTVSRLEWEFPVD